MLRTRFKSISLQSSGTPSIFGHCIRFITGERYLHYAEERDPTIWESLSTEKLANVAHHGRVGPQQGASDAKEQPAKQSNGDRDGDSQCAVRLDLERGKDVHIIYWSGPDDPENPMNWSLFKKSFVTFQICLLTVSVYIRSAIYSAGVLDVMRVFGVGEVAALSGLTTFVAGYGVGPMLWSPISEVPYIGRNPIYFRTLVVFVVFQVPTALATNFGMFLAFRFLTGFFGSPVLATGRTSLRDMYRPAKRAYEISIWGLFAICGPTWTIWETMCLSGFCLVIIFFFLPETSAQNILYRRTRRLRKLKCNGELKCEPKIMAEQMTRRDTTLMTLVRPFTLNPTEPVVFLLNLYIALIYGLLYIWFESFLINPRSTTAAKFSLRNVLPPACVGGFFIPICLFWFSWSARPEIHWLMPIVGSRFFTVGAFLLSNGVLHYLQDAFSEYAASVLAGNELFRSSFGAGFPLLAIAMYRRLGVDWASSLLAFLGIAFIPIPFVLWYYGASIRKRSKRAREDF
ncbi:putative caffeine resistance protein 5 [Patellaria atrata CBS 101060]|uniref:Caffeine resistance protein 5 n=1 Tax=Patellaria atrata CBS 101060 TaxID=1346257 RepID=A0A9P4SID3_9PEZI|nr:putative caffeine resistance protein 5 [Patellaria atrata CBS 101060]